MKLIEKTHHIKYLLLQLCMQLCVNAQRCKDANYKLETASFAVTATFDYISVHTWTLFF